MYSGKRLTKILATIGPATANPEKVRELIESGVNVFRFNLKHDELPAHEERINLVREIAYELDVPIGVLIDLQGPEIRIQIESGGFELEIGEELFIGKIPAGSKGFAISHPEALAYLEKGQKVVADDGRFHFEVLEVAPDQVKLQSKSIGMLKTRKTLNIPGTNFPLPPLTKKDEEAVKMAARVPVDYIALSFVRTKEDVHFLKNKMREHGAEARVIAKIETQISTERIDEIIDSTEGIMVARGDLGIELPIEQVPYYQKKIIKKCMERGFPVITATQMLASMTDRPYPSRAEISDIANAVYDYTDTLMLSEETAAGNFPKEAVETMAKTAVYNERRGLLEDMRKVFDYHIVDLEEMLCDTAYNVYLRLLKKDMPVGGFLVFTQTGRTARKLARYRPHAPIYVFAPDAKVQAGLTLSYGVKPFAWPAVFKKGEEVKREHMQEAIVYLNEKKMYDPKKHYILLYGDNWLVEGHTTSLKVVVPTE